MTLRNSSTDKTKAQKKIVSKIFSKEARTITGNLNPQLMRSLRM